MNCQTCGSDLVNGICLFGCAVVESTVSADQTSPTPPPQVIESIPRKQSDLRPTSEHRAYCMIHNMPYLAGAETCAFCGNETGKLVETIKVVESSGVDILGTDGLIAYFNNAAPLVLNLDDSAIEDTIKRLNTLSAVIPELAKVYESERLRRVSEGRQLRTAEDLKYIPRAVPVDKAVKSKLQKSYDTFRGMGIAHDKVVSMLVEIGGSDAREEIRKLEVK